MKKVFLAAVAFAAITFASCSDKKAEMKKEFIAKCKADGASQMPNEKAKAAFDKFCECSGEKVVNKFSEKEMEEFEANKNDAAKQAEMQAKLMPVIQPCADDMQKEIMASMGAGQ